MLRLAGREIDSVNINGVKHNIAELQTSLDLAGLPGVVPTYTVVFGHRPEDGDTEVVSVAYLASYELEDGKARYDATNAISMEIMLQCNARPYKIIPLDAQDLQKTSLGKLSASKVRRMFENGQFEEQEKLNKQLLFDYLASVAAKTATETNGSDEENLNPTERAIRQAVSEVMDIPPAHLGLDTGIMQMGVNSMQLIHFKKRIEELVAIADIPMITILTNPTIRELAAAVCGQPEMGTPEDPISEYNPVVIMNKTGSGAPLWLVHPGAGEILVYLNLAKYFVDERPVYAIRARGFDGEPFFRDTMECISTYFDAIKRVQPEGPYNILGYSFGSMFAFEIAKQLQTVGDSIAFLGVLNLPPHIKQRIRQLNMVTAVLTLSLFLGLVEDDDPETFSPNIASMTYDDVLDDILAHRAPPGRMIELALDRAKLLRWAEVSNALHEMAWDYEPSGMVNIVDVFVAHPLKAVASNREDWFEKQISRWVHFSRTLPRFHEAEGEHFSMTSMSEAVRVVMTHWTLADAATSQAVLALNLIGMCAVHTISPARFLPLSRLFDVVTYPKLLESAASRLA
jgi:thioesterase domain-containing protein